MSFEKFITLKDETGATAVIAPELGGWLLRYARPMSEHGVVEALYCTQEIIDRYPNQMYAGNPILFPFVSFNRLNGVDHRYEWNGKVHELPQHGFARRSVWQVRESSPSSVTLELTDSPAIRANYPFAFSYQLRYWLANGRLHWEQTVTNRSPETLPFSSGFHPYFSVPLSKAGKRDECYVELPAARQRTPNADFSEYAITPFPAQRLSVGQDVSGTLFLDQLSEPEVRLVDPNSKLAVVYNFADAPKHRSMALWSKSTSEPFYCIEPWTSLPNVFGRKAVDELTLLAPGETFRAAMWIDIQTQA